jgi:hypothetical protein
MLAQTLGLAGCARYPFKSFAELAAAPEPKRLEGLRQAVQRAGLQPTEPGLRLADRLLLSEGLAARLDARPEAGGFAPRFERVAPLLFRAAPNADGKRDDAAVTAGASWLLGHLGLEATEALLAEAERGGGQVAVHRAPAVEARRALEEEARRRHEALWGPFEAWSGRSANAGAIDSVLVLLNGEADLRRLRAAHAAEKRGNDRQVRAARTVEEPIYPQVSGAFAFVKILDRGAGESLFSANDGPFILRLSEGDSFSAYPGQLIRMTMHNRGERMEMTNGNRLPVFHSGRSPTTERFIPGFDPDRTEEERLAARVSALEAVQTQDRAAMKEEAPGRFVLAKGAPVRLVFQKDRKGGWQRVAVQDTESQQEIYCLRVKGGDCAGARQEVALADLVKARPGR